jgi:hypothetical protein
VSENATNANDEREREKERENASERAVGVWERDRTMGV